MSSSEVARAMRETDVSQPAEGRPAKAIRLLDRLQVFVLFAVLALHPTDFSIDLGGERGTPQRHVYFSLGLMGKPDAVGKTPHLYVTLADLLIAAGLAAYLARRALRGDWRKALFVPLPLALLVVWFALSGLRFLKPGGGRDFEVGGLGFFRELMQVFEYLIAAYLLFHEGFRRDDFRRAAAVILMVVATAVTAWAWVQYLNVDLVKSALNVSGPLRTRNSLAAALAMLLPFAWGVGLFSGRRLLLVWSALLLAAGLAVMLSGGAFAATALAVLALAYLRDRRVFLVVAVVLLAAVAVSVSLADRLPRSNFHVLQDSLLLFRAMPSEAAAGRDFERGPDPYRVLPFADRIPTKVQAAVTPAEKESWPWRQKFKEWQAALVLIGRSPLFGVGGGRLADNADAFYNKTTHDARSMPKLAVDLMEPEAENFYLNLAAGIGLPALLMLLWLLLDHARLAASGLAGEGLTRGMAAGSLGALIGFAAAAPFADPWLRGAGLTFAAILALAGSLRREAEAAAGLPAAEPAPVDDRLIVRATPAPAGDEEMGEETRLTETRPPDVAETETPPAPDAETPDAAVTETPSAAEPEPPQPEDSHEKQP